MQIRLNNRVAVVTGGSRGIGRAISLSIATTGATVVVNYRGNQAAADETVAAIVAAGGHAVA
ncbi:MAG: SDR family NAD(P)-dependent oxidoreductase, partial [Chloroflexia bacterium]|nr:SDR family NAD(P)-dependent oxidoreductase [Chloroflexia bacterium]